MGVNRLLVKQVELTFPDPKKTAPENWKASCVITGNLVAAFRVHETFQTADHEASLKDGQGGVRKWNVMRSEAELEETIACAPTQVARRLWQVTKTGT